MKKQNLRRSPMAAITACAAVLGAFTGMAVAQESTPSASENDILLEEILVTANRREQRLADVAIAVSVYDQKTLDSSGITIAEDLARLAPTISQPGLYQSAQLAVRGFGGNNFSESASETAVLVVGGAVRPHSSSVGFYDLDRIEVLEGPQGLLFGASGSSGVMNVTTAKPDASDFSAAAQFQAGQHNFSSVEGFVNLPLTDNAAVRIAGLQRKDVEQFRNRLANSGEKPANQMETDSFRVSFSWEPSDNLAFDAIYEYVDNVAQGGHYQTFTFADPGSELIDVYRDLCGIEITSDNTDVCKRGPANFSQSKTRSASANIAYSFDGGSTLTSITGYNHYDNGGDRGLDIGPLTWLNQDIDRYRKLLTQELRLDSAGGEKLDYTVGAYYSTEERSGYNGLWGPIASNGNFGVCGPDYLESCWYAGPVLSRAAFTDIELGEMAVFGQATYAVTDQFKLIAGLRIGSYDVDNSVFYAEIPRPDSEGLWYGGPTVDESFTDDYESFRVGLQYYPSTELMLFTTYTEGFRPGLVNDAAVPAGFSVVLEPEIPKQSEVGFKWTLDSALLNVTAWHTEMENYQFQIYDPTTVTTILANAPTATSMGVSAQLIGEIGDNFSGSISAAYMDATYGSGTLTSSTRLGVVDASGLQLNFTPEWSASAAGEYQFNINSNYQGFVGGTISYRGERPTDTANTPDFVLSSKTIVNAEIGARSIDGRYGVTFFARNLTDEFDEVWRRNAFGGGNYGSPNALASIVGTYYKRTFGIAINISM